METIKTNKQTKTKNEKKKEKNKQTHNRARKIRKLQFDDVIIICVTERKEKYK